MRFCVYVFASSIRTCGNFFFISSSNEKLISPYVRESKTVLDSGFEALNSRFQELDSSLCQWNLDSEFQSLVGFCIL